MNTTTETASCTEHIRLPDFELESLARIILPMVQKFYEADEGKASFEEWYARQKKSAA